MNYEKPRRPHNVPCNCSFCGLPMADWEILLSDTHAQCIKKQQAKLKDDKRRRDVEIMKQQAKLF